MDGLVIGADGCRWEISYMFEMRTIARKNPGEANGMSVARLSAMGNVGSGVPMLEQVTVRKDGSSHYNNERFRPCEGRPRLFGERPRPFAEVRNVDWRWERSDEEGTHGRSQCCGAGTQGSVGR